MLESLHVKNLALIEEEEVSFKDGFNVLTGETGAGKSIILGSINYALGLKAGKDVIRAGEEYALVELVFSVNEREKERIEALGIPVEDDGTVVLSRRIMSSRSVCRINAETVPSSLLMKAGEILIDLYGQHENQSLLKKSNYLGLIDDFSAGKSQPVKDRLKSVKEKLDALKEEERELSGDETVREREADLLDFELKEIADAALSEGEDEELEQRYRLLNNMQRIEESVTGASACTGEDGEGALALIGRALQKLSQAEGYDERITEFRNELSEIEDLLQGFQRSASSYLDSLTFDGGELLQIEERLDLINRLKSKYGGSIASVLESAKEKEEALSKLRNHDELVRKVRKDLEETFKEALSLCGELSDIRKKTAPQLEKQLTESLHSLNFPEVRFRIEITSDEEKIGANGYDEAEFLICLNAGEELRPMQNVASGGELSRIMLALKSIFADREDVHTLVFDEIDAGISGVTAFKVAGMMGRLSRSHQLLAITHLPQIAAKGDIHFVIEKSVEEGRTKTKIRELTDDGKIRELARLLGSDEISDAALNNARDLIQKAKLT
ncbi:MAG: DNA repair protein RecN [Lachnospiraceae bacterium]|nr:DNA repair protein RecN [Lachnospiraceae bacterium]